MTDPSRQGFDGGDWHQGFMALALRLARKARQQTWPNPMVGAVVVKGKQVLGVGYHHRAGEPHAEVEALEQAGKMSRGADLYVTLEPCHLSGRTGPCTDQIKAAGIKRVIVGTRDPNPKESGRGLKTLRQNGVEVLEGVLEESCRSLNEVYNVFIRENRPFVLVKAASSLDGRLATWSGDSRWISGMESRKHAHRLRAASNAVLVGAGTVRRDDPRLDVRQVKGPHPAVVILDAKLSVSPKARLFAVDRGAPVWIYSKQPGDSRKQSRLTAAGAEIIAVSSRRGLLDLREVLQDLFSRGVYRLLVEGGAAVIGSLFASRLVDRVELHLSPCFLGADGVPLGRCSGPRQVSLAPRLEKVLWRRRGEDMSCSGRVAW